MANQVTLVLADSNESASLVMDKFKLKPEDTAVIDNPMWLSYTEIRSQETIYMTSTCPTEVNRALLGKVDNDLQSGQNITVIVIKI